MTDSQEIIIDSLQEFLERNGQFQYCTFIGLDFTGQAVDWSVCSIEQTTFLGCALPLEDELEIRRRGAYIYRAPDNLPYRPFRNRLYTWQELMEGLENGPENTLDYRIYRHFVASRFDPPINEALWQRMHDHGIDHQLRTLIGLDRNGGTRLRCVGFMGGHGEPRHSEMFRRSALTAKLLAEDGYFIASGGGPGIMEAANLGAYLAGKPTGQLDQALAILGEAPHYTSPGYHEAALRVLELHPQGQSSLAIPTWFYGHEPSNLFADQIAKYFSNSIREDTLLAISLYGIVFAPGSAGTIQEIFMDAAQNHYGTFNYYSPMIFLGRQRYEIDTMIFPLLRQLSWQRPYGDLLHLTDDPWEVLAFLRAHPPVAVNAD